MNEAIQLKSNIVSQLKHLCAHCATGNKHMHSCPIESIAVRVQSLRGVPLVVNSEFKGMLWA